MKQTCLIAVMLLLAAMVGCRHDGNVEITGKVTLDGVPLEKGEIRFIPADGQGRSAGALIQGGQYVARVAPGVKTVVVAAYQKVGERPLYQGKADSPMSSVTQKVAEETLTYEVTGSATKDFELKTK